MDFFDVQTYSAIKLLLLLFVAVAIYLFYKKKPVTYFLGLTGFISAGAYFLLVNNLDLSFYSLQGDEITLAAMYNTFAHVSLGADFAYHGLPAFYPPAFFWIFGLIGYLLNLNGVVILKLAACCFFLVFPLATYYLGKIVVKNINFGEKTPGKLFIFLVPLLVMTILDKDLLFSKPYEVITGVATIFWCLILYLTIAADKFKLKQLIIHGVVAGLIFMTYYLWLVFAAMALIILGLVEQRRTIVKYFWLLFQTMLIALIVALPFLFPLLSTYAKLGMENWQTAFFTPEGLKLWLPMFELNSFNALILLFGLVTLIYYRHRAFVKQLLYLLLIAFIWWGIGLALLIIFKKPFQEFRGFYIWSPVILVMAAAYGFERLSLYFKISDHKKYYPVLVIIGILYFASQSIFGFFVDNLKAQAYRQEAKKINQPLSHLVAYLKTDIGVSSKLTLQTVPQVLAFVPINHLLYFNQNNGHPASIFSKRYQYVQDLAKTKTSEELYAKIKACPYGQLERFIFFKDSENYYLYFHLNKIIDGITEQDVIFKQSLFDSNHFQKVYDNDGYVIIDVKL